MKLLKELSKINKSGSQIFVIGLFIDIQIKEFFTVDPP